MELFSTPVKDIYYRQANDNDSPIIRELIFTILKGYGLNTDQLETDRDMFEIEKYYPEGHFWVIVDTNNDIKGSLALFYPNDSQAEVKRMYFSSSIRGKGLGKWALKFLEETALRQSRTSLWLETSSVLKEAIRLYIKNGFIKSVGSCHSSRCDIVMEKKLT